LIFASFSTFWTALVLPLSAEPFSYSHAQIGLFGLVGLAGAFAATYAGRLADRGHGQWTTGISLALLLASWALIALLPFSISLLLVGVLLLDLAVRAVHVTSLSVIVALHPHENGRLIGGYMAFYSAGSGIGAIATTTAYAHFGWLGVSAVGRRSAHAHLCCGSPPGLGESGMEVSPLRWIRRCHSLGNLFPVIGC
jgi:MFS family permease